MCLLSIFHKSSCSIGGCEALCIARDEDAIGNVKGAFVKTFLFVFYFIFVIVPEETAGYQSQKPSGCES